MSAARGGVLEWEYLLEELALYFLIHSEAANLRHMPEALWFLYWVVRNSPTRIAQVTGIPGTHPKSANVAAHAEAHKGVIRKQLHLRNRYFREIDQLRAELGVKPDGDYKGNDELAAIRDGAAAKLGPLFQGATVEVDLLADMVAYGDSGAFLDRIVDPVFNYLAETVGRQGAGGVDIQWRVAYDDANESLCSRAQVHRVLGELGVRIKGSSRRRKIEWDLDPYEALLSLKERRHQVVGGAGPVAGPQAVGFEHGAAAAWWGDRVFGKTFVERRSWLSMMRAFFRVWLFLILEFQTMCVFLWAGDKERGWAWPLADRQWYWLSTLVGTHAVACLVYEVAGAWTQRSTKRGVRVLGDPFNRHHAGGVLVWIAIVGALVVAFVAQQLDFLGGVTVWWYAAGGYAGLAAAHAVLSQRDGYTVSLANGTARLLRRCHLVPLAWPFEFAGRFSARPPAEQYLAPYYLKTGWSSFLSNALFWTLVLGAKCVFDWYAVMQTMRLGVQALMNADWLGSIGWERVPNPDPTLPPTWQQITTGFNLDIILAIGRVLPGFLVVMNDGQVFYYIIGSVFGVLKGLLQQNLGSITTFQELVLTFHKAPVYWWKRCTSARGQANIARNVERALTPAPDAATGAGGAGMESLADIVRRRATDRGAQLISEQIVDATAQLASRFSRADSKSRALHLHDANLPVWVAFSDVWNGIVAELRDIDLVSNAEAQNLRFINIELDESTAVISGMRPLMLPVFFYGGQVARALESPGADPTQGVVLSEIRALLVFVLAQTGIVTPGQAAALAAFQAVRKPSSLKHRAARSKGVDRVTALLTKLRGVMAPCPDAPALAHRSDSVKSLAALLGDLCEVAEFEARAVLAEHRAPARSPSETDASRLRHTQAANLVEVLRELREARLEERAWGEFWGEEGGLDAFFHEAEPSTARDNVAKVVGQLLKMLTTSARGAQPRGEEAQRLLSFFMGSLKNPTLETPPAVDDMLSWNVLTPHYEEDVLYALSAKHTAAHFNLPVSTTKGMSDLMSENEVRGGGAGRVSRGRRRSGRASSGGASFLGRKHLVHANVSQQRLRAPLWHLISSHLLPSPPPPSFRPRRAGRRDGDGLAALQLPRRLGQPAGAAGARPGGGQPQPAPRQRDRLRRRRPHAEQPHAPPPLGLVPRPATGAHRAR
jgi:hypothetical protein